MNVNIEKIAALNAALDAYEKKNGAITEASVESSNWTCTYHGNCTWACDGSCARSCAGSSRGR